MSSLDIIRSRDNRPYLKLLISSCSLSCVVPPCIQVRNMMPEASYFSMLNCCISVRSLKPFARDPEVTQYFISALVASFCGTLKTKAFILLSPFSVASNPFSISFILLNNSLSCVEVHPDSLKQKHSRLLSLIVTLLKLMSGHCPNQIVQGRQNTG